MNFVLLVIGSGGMFAFGIYYIIEAEKFMREMPEERDEVAKQVKFIIDFALVFILGGLLQIIS